MPTPFSRRQFVAAVPGFTLAGVLLNGLPVTSVRAADESPGKNSRLWPEFPRQDAKLVKEVVGASHFNEVRVRELVELKPALVNAWVDWSFGDWESPLGAASHTGRRTIAEFLIEKGARIDIFAAAMLGMTDVVKAFVAASPGIQRTHGPHGIPLLAHAEVGGDKARNTYEYLQSLGDAGNPIQPTKPISDEQRQALLGRYRFGPGPTEELEVKLDKQSRLNIEGPGETRQMIHHVGDNEFYPAGVPSVRVRFKMENGKPVSLIIMEREPIVTAVRATT